MEEFWQQFNVMNS